MATQNSVDGSAPLSSHDDKEFAQFYERMKVTKRAFVLKNSASTGFPRAAGKPAAPEEQRIVNPNFFEDDDDAVVFMETNEVVNQSPLTEDQKTRIRQENAAQRQQWTNLCRMEFGLRNRNFAARFPSKSTFYLYFTIPLILVACLVFVAWPVWNILVDLEAEDHYSVLGIKNGATAAEIKKAYREQTKKWHPDVNPGCGEPCRNKMIQLQQAHDVLLARGDRSNELANKYSEGLSQIRSLLVFRLYQISFHAAEFTNTLVLATIPALKSFKHIVRRSTRVGFILAFVALEVIFVTGLNPIVLIQVFYFCATMLRQSAALSDIQKISKWSYIDIRTDALVFVLPAIVAHGLWYALLNSSFSKSAGEYGWHMFVGTSYLCAHLQRFSPNLWDNIAFKKCSVTLEYLSQPQFQQTKWNIFLAELGVLVDDVFAFSSHVPSPFRIAVLAVHGLYLAQFLLLPHDAPIKGKLRRKELEGDGKASRGKDKSAKQAKVAQPGEPSKKVPLTEREVTWFADLDNEQVLWFDLASVKYVRHLERSALSAKQNPGQPSFLATSSGTEVVICVLRNNTIDITERIYDPAAAHVLAREGGPGSLIDIPRKQVTQEMALARHAALLPHSKLLSSQMFRRGLDGNQREGGSASLLILLGAAGALLLSAVCVGNLPTMKDADLLFDPLAPPSAQQKHRHALGADHLLNQGAGLLPLASGPLAVAVPDMFDTLRQMALYSTENTEAYAVVAQQKPSSKKQPQQRKGQGSGNSNQQQRQRSRARTE